MDAKRTSFVGILSALGLALSAISLNIAPILTTVGNGGAALDLSHIATFIGAIFGGPIVGGLVGLFGGLYAGYYFGFTFGQGLLAVVAVPLGKAMTGIMAGLLYKKLKVTDNSHSIYTIPATLLSYIPESIYTILYFLYIVAFVNGVAAMTFMVPIVFSKGWIEITVMSIIMGALAGNTGFREFINRFLSLQKLPKQAKAT